MDRVGTLPALTVDLIRLLDETFPHRCPDPEVPERKIWMQAGARQLVDWLISRRDDTPEGDGVMPESWIAPI